jgi:protein-disulfide isomerase
MTNRERTMTMSRLFLKTRTGYTAFATALTLATLGIPVVANAAPPAQPASSTVVSQQTVKKVTSPATPDQKAAPAKPIKPAEVKRRLINVNGGQFSLDIRQWPLIGKPDAKYVFVEMFDYTCPYCRATHQAVRGAIEHFGDDLAIIALPVPLDASCNRTVAQTAPEHADACEIARISVAVWRVNRAKFAEFHSWLFDPSYRPSAGDAFQRAAQLVGDKAIRDELAKPTAGSYVARHVDLYERVGAGSLPKIIFSNTSVSGSVEAASTLIDMINQNGLAPQ